MCFIENGAVLRARSPARHQFIQSRLAGWASALRQPKGIGAPRPPSPAPARPARRLRRAVGRFPLRLTRQAFALADRIDARRCVRAQ